MNIPNMKQIAEEAMEDAVKSVKSRARELVLGILGIEDRWELRVKGESEFLNEIKASDKFVQFKKDMYDAIVSDASFKMSAADRKRLIADFRDNVYYQVREEILGELKEELVNRTIDDLKKDPAFNPVFVADALLKSSKR